jgi:hypothetical protein
VWLGLPTFWNLVAGDFDRPSGKGATKPEAQAQRYPIDLPCQQVRQEQNANNWKHPAPRAWCPVNLRLLWIVLDGLHARTLHEKGEMKMSKLTRSIREATVKIVASLLRIEIGIYDWSKTPRSLEDPIKADDLRRPQGAI